MNKYIQFGCLALISLLMVPLVAMDGLGKRKRKATTQSNRPAKRAKTAQYPETKAADILASFKDKQAQEDAADSLHTFSKEIILDIDRIEKEQAIYAAMCKRAVGEEPTVITAPTINIGTIINHGTLQMARRDNIHTYPPVSSQPAHNILSSLGPLIYKIANAVFPHHIQQEDYQFITPSPTRQVGSISYYVKK